MKAKNGSKRAMCMDEDTIAYILEQYENAPGGDSKPIDQKRLEEIKKDPWHMWADELFMMWKYSRKEKMIS